MSKVKIPDIHELLTRDLISDESMYEWRNKMTDEEYNEWKKTFPRNELFVKEIDREILYKILKDEIIVKGSEKLFNRNRK